MSIELLALSAGNCLDALKRGEEKENEGVGQFYKITNSIIDIVIAFVMISQLCSCQKHDKITLYVNPSVPNVDVAFQEENYEEVLEQYMNQLKNVAEDSDEAARICTSIGDLYTYNIRDRDKAIQYLEKAIEIDQKNQNEIGLADDYYVMSNVYVEMGGSAAEGVEYAEKAEELYKRHVGENSIEVADTLSNKGVIYYDSDQWERALENFEAAQKIYESLHEETGYTCTNIGKTLLDLKEYDKAEEVLKKARKLSEAAGKKYYSADADFYLGRLYLKKDECEKATDYFKRALDFYETDTKYLYDTVLAYNNLAHCLVEVSGRWEDGMPYVIKACQSIESMSPLTGQKKSTQEILKNLLRQYYDKWKPEAGDQDFEVWYQKAVLDGEGWEEE